MGFCKPGPGLLLVWLWGWAASAEDERGVRGILCPSLVPGPKPWPASWQMRTVVPGCTPDLQLSVEWGRGKRRKGRWPARKDPLWDLTLGGAEDADLSSEVQKGCHIPHWIPKASVCPTA